MLSCSIHEEHSQRTLGDMSPDFVEMQLHRFGVGVGVGQSKRRSFSVSRADGAEEKVIRIALVGGLPWS